MALRPIVLYPDPVLLNPTREVGEITDERFIDRGAGEVEVVEILGER